MEKMATKKTCNYCGKSKPTTDFHKKTKAKDGLQSNCKACVKSINTDFREVNPKYQVDWQRTNKEYWCDYMCKYKKADKNSLIYKITAPDGKVYIGQTKTRMFVRFTYHKVHYKQKYMCIPLLHKSFDKFGIENHKFELLLDLGDLERTYLTQIESSLIKEYKKLGLSLNVN